jgi:PAS domain S-box-containing protein
MTGVTRTRAHELALALRDHVAGAQELARLHAYQISRDAMSAGAGLLEVVADHQEALAIVLSGAWTQEQSVGWVQASAELVAESLGPFEMAYRGFQEANTTLTRLNQNLELQIADRHQAAIIQSSADAIISRTLDGIITSWNAGAERTYGYTAAEMVGTDGYEVIPPGRRGELPAIVDRLARDGRFEVYETQRIRKDGVLLDVAVTISPIRDGAGTIVGSSTVGRDITESKRAEAVRRSLEERMHQSERLESLGQLAGGVAHDFNNLLAVILNYAAFVAEETADNPAVAADVAQILTAAERAARLTRQLLTFGRRDVVRTESLDLNAVVDDVHNLLSRSIGEHISLIVDAAHPLPSIRADRGQMEQVLLNFAVNARDAMPKGGTLTISTRATDLDAGDARLDPSAVAGRYVELSVSDTGTGIDREVASHIFEPFFTTKPKGEGTGLGLATVYGIVTEAGGSTTVDSEVGVGTTFRVLLPVAA